MQQWEYCTLFQGEPKKQYHWLVNLPTGEMVDLGPVKAANLGFYQTQANALNRLGADGWELVLESGSGFTLKRPKQP